MTDGSHRAIWEYFFSPKSNCTYQEACKWMDENERTGQFLSMEGREEYQKMVTERFGG